MLKQLVGVFTVTIALAFALAPSASEAKRLGGAKSSGMQRNTAPDKPPQSAPASPNQSAAAPAAAAGATAAAAKRSWMGPIAGLAAGLGLVALFSALGMGEGFANFVMLALLAVVAIAVIRMLMRRFADGGMASRPVLAAAGVGAGRSPTATPPQFVDERPGRQGQLAREALPSVTIGSALATPESTTLTTAPNLPAGFDSEGFERVAKMLFIRMQAANDCADLNDLRQFTTPELFASLRVDLLDRGDATQTTDVVKVEAQLVDYAQEADRQIVSVRFSGLIREEVGGEAAPFNEVWHLMKPEQQSDGPWLIAGIQQAQ